MTVRFTAEIIDDEGNVVENRIREANGIPGPETFDLSTEEGFLRDFDSLEQAILTARNQIGKDITEGVLSVASAKKALEKCRKVEIESEIGRIQVHVFERLMKALKPKINSKAYLLLAAKACIHMSYRDAAEMLRLFLHREEQDAFKLRTLSDTVNRVGDKISEELEKITSEVLGMFGFDQNTGLPQVSAELSDHLMTDTSAFSDPLYIHQIQEAVDAVNQSSAEKVSLDAEKSELKAELSGCVYISVDEVGVKRQKDSRAPGSARDSKYVENTVIHIQYGSDCYILTANGIYRAMKSALTFLTANGMLRRELVFFTDGARNIKNSIESLFAFHSYVIVLDWFHLKKKCQELLSMALKGRDIRNDVLTRLTRL